MSTERRRVSARGAMKAAAVLRAQGEAIAAAIDEEFFDGEPPARVDLVAVMTRVPVLFARRRDALIDSELAYVAVRKKNGSIPADAPAISPEVAARLTHHAQIEPLLDKAQRVARAPTKDTGEPNPVPALIAGLAGDSTRAWLAAVADWAEARGAAGDPLEAPHQIEGVLLMIAGFATMAGCDEVEEELRSAMAAR